ncbi:YceD family protein [Herbaspirillum sp. alder98]|uniref:YceD family protein n=1 Tax=Herbaspirillum sp. alder98 TaxID=2913096 RepID=UPI001CD8F337|nr:YceD family protein [Herbaspirillum sp. alder98]MCA1322726.1 YceD family protein [Herbaspirillum sp. alder98]
MNALVIDAFEFCRHKQQAQGQVPVAELGRLAQETVDRSGAISWALSGDIDKLGHAQLSLAVSGVVHLTCQRCLTALPFEIDSKSLLVLAKDEAQADAIEQLLDDDQIDVIVGSAAFDAANLVEDEALLALPVAPKHDVCPDSGVVAEAKGTERASPFAVLKKLKQ